MIAQIQIVSMIAFLGYSWSGLPQESDMVDTHMRGDYGGTAIPVEFKNGQFGIILRDDTEGNPPSKEIPMDPNAKIPRPPIGGTENVSISSSTPALQVGERARVSLTKGAVVDALILSGHAEVRIEEGAKVSAVDISDSATLKIFSGETIAVVNVRNNSDDAEIQIEERAEIAHLTVAGSTTLKISGATISHVTVQENSIAYVFGGNIGFLNLEGHGQAHIHGTTLQGGLYSSPDLTFTGGGITYAPETQIHLYATDVMFRAGKISGIWDNGKPFSIHLVGVQFDEKDGERKNLAQPKSLPKQVIIPKIIEASFDCAKAVSPAEKTICGDPTLANLDRRLSGLYRQVLETASDSEQVKASQRHWLRTIRNGCITAPCMKTAYERRIAILGKMSKKPR